MMFHPHKNSYLQLVCAINPRVINKAVDMAMQRGELDLRTEIPAAKRLESMQPSLYSPHVDITRARLGFGRIGLRLLIRDLHSPNHLVQIQAIHTLLDQVQISENAIFLINLHIVDRLTNLMLNPNPVIKEKICMILTSLATYYQARQRMVARPRIIEHLTWLTMRERKEIRYVAANTLRSLSKDKCCIETLLQSEDIIENLLKMVKNEHTSIIAIHLETLESLFEWDQETPLKANSFQIMLKLMVDSDPKIICGAMNCMTQLCKHDVGRKLADIHDLTNILRRYLVSEFIEVVISAVGLMAYTTLTTRSKWRAKEFCVELTERLVNLCLAPSKPLLQLRCMQVLINLCDCPDIRYHMKKHWQSNVRSIYIRTHEEWDGTSETVEGFDSGHNYRTQFVDGTETVKNDIGDNPAVINVHSYVKHLRKVKEQLLYAINLKPYAN